MKRPGLLFGAPLVLLLAWAVLPLARGGETLFLRDTFNAHLEMKAAEARSIAGGFFPEIDPYRAGGQPLAGNPNAVPFYPDNLLYLAASPIWALNAHLWIHLLLAPFAFAWLARAWGLGRGPAWVAAACYTVSGFFLSHLSFYNLIAGAALAPALVAACLALAGRRGSAPRPALAPVLAVLWALLLLGGDPLMAGLALALAGGALAVSIAADAVRRRSAPSPAPDSLAAPGAPLAPSPARSRSRSPLLLLLAALASGTLVAAPQLVELLRILPLSFRGHWGYTAQVATVASWDPRQAAEWLLPFLFGRPDVLGPGSFWGSRFFTDVPPYYLSLYPGLLALALVVAAGLPRGRRTAALWAWGAIAAGVFLALGRFNPLALRVLDLAGKGSLRYPVKLWLPVAVGAALLCGIGFERVFEERDPGARRRFAFALGALAGVFAAGWIALALLPGVSGPRLRRLIPAGYPDVFVANERLRWAGLCLVSLALLAALALAARWALRRPAAAALGRLDSSAAALVVIIHVAAQLLLLRPLVPTDAVYPYLVPPPALDLLPPGETVVNGSFTDLFGPSSLERGDFPAPRALWLERRAFYELYPMTGPLWGRRYELDVSPEGLDSFLTRMAQGAVKHSADDALRVRLLAAWGVGRLILDRPLDAGALGSGSARLLGEIPSFGGALRVYGIDGRAPALYLARRALEAPHLNAAYQLLTDPRFRPGEDVVLAGGGPLRSLAGGSILSLRRGPESLDAEVAAAGTGVLVVDRAHLPLYRASVDDRAAAVEVANLDRIAIAVPAGPHRVRLWIDRRPLAAAVAVALLGILSLAWLAVSARRARAIIR